MSILVVGSAAFDTVETPSGKVEGAIGGSAVYFSISASFFTPIKLVAVIGRDFPGKTIDFLKKRKIDLDGLEITDGKTFHWEGRYGNDLNVAETVKTELNVFSSFAPKLPPSYRDSKYVFLANIDPGLQEDIIGQVNKPELIACDTMNHWIQNKRESLIKILPRVDILIINEMETKQLAGENNILKAGRKILSYGLGALVIKRGEYGVLYMDGTKNLAIPGFPLLDPCDPTGAGDSFAGGFLGHLVRIKEKKPETDIYSKDIVCEAMLYGSIMGSFCVENFSINRYMKLKNSEIKDRFNKYIKLLP